LNVPRLVGLRGELSIGGRRDAGAQAAEPDAVESVDHLEAELECDALFVDEGVLDEAHVRVADGDEAPLQLLGSSQKVMGNRRLGQFSKRMI
jgi:hypothetical protein